MEDTGDLKLGDSIIETTPTEDGGIILSFNSPYEKASFGILLDRSQVATLSNMLASGDRMSGMGIRTNQWLRGGGDNGTTGWFRYPEEECDEGFNANTGVMR